jgi:hypothetical protein
VHNRPRSRSYDLFCEYDWTIERVDFSLVITISHFHKIKQWSMSWLWTHILTRVKSFKAVFPIIYTGFKERKRKRQVIVRKAKPNLHDMWTRDLCEKYTGHRKFESLSKSSSEKHRFSHKCNHWNKKVQIMELGFCWSLSVEFIYETIRDKGKLSTHYWSQFDNFKEKKHQNWTKNMHSKYAKFWNSSF